MSEADGDFRILALRSWGYSSDEPVPCVGCSKSGHVHLHHYRPKGMGGTDDPTTDEPENLLPLCVSTSDRQGCHDAVHAERLRLVWVEGVVDVLDPATGEIVARTPWPPVKGLLREVGQLAMTAKDSADAIGKAVHALTAPELSFAAGEVHQISLLLDRDKAHLAHERLERAPSKHRQKVAEAVAAEWSERGYSVSPSTVWGLANEWRLLNSLPAETWDATPTRVRRYAVGGGHSEEEAHAIVDAYHDRPEDMGVVEFIQEHRAASQPVAKADVCPTCNGSGHEPCAECGGSGKRP